MLVVIAGLGSIGRRHLRNLRKLCPQATIVGLRRSTNSNIPEHEMLDRVVEYGQLSDILSQKPNLAIICTPASHHEGLASSFLKAGSYVLVEKPVAACTTSLSELIDLVKRSPSSLMVGYNLRFSSALRALYDAVARGLIGRTLGFRCSVGMYLPHWRPEQDYRASVSANHSLGGGALLELSHEIDYLLWLLGKPNRVFCSAHQLGPLEMDVENWVDLILHFESGVKGALHLDLLDPRHHRECSIIGTEGTLFWDAIKNSVTISTTDNPAGEHLYREPKPDRNGSYLEQMRHVLGVAQGTATPLVTLDEGVAVLRVIQCAQTSNRAEGWIECEGL